MASRLDLPVDLVLDLYNRFLEHRWTGVGSSTLEGDATMKTRLFQIGMMAVLIVALVPLVGCQKAKEDAGEAVEEAKEMAYRCGRCRG